MACPLCGGPVLGRPAPDKPGTTLMHCPRCPAAPRPEFSSDENSDNVAHRQLCDLRDVLTEAERIAREWTEAGHGEECLCPFCRSLKTIECTAWDVAGIEWMASHAASMVDSVTTGEPRKVVLRG